jgi:hypothetical protein
VCLDVGGHHFQYHMSTMALLKTCFKHGQNPQLDQAIASDSLMSEHLLTAGILLHEEAVTRLGLKERMNHFVFCPHCELSHKGTG